MYVLYCNKKTAQNAFMSVISRYASLGHCIPESLTPSYAFTLMHTLATIPGDGSETSVNTRFMQFLCWTLCPWVLRLQKQVIPWAVTPLFFFKPQHLELFQVLPLSRVCSRLLLIHTEGTISTY